MDKFKVGDKISIIPGLLKEYEAEGIVEGEEYEVVEVEGDGLPRILVDEISFYVWQDDFDFLDVIKSKLWKVLE